ncbi:GNAT family N-acetyltransferase [Simiduia curdlanivorans]|uniref:GNAT family N-acetyltransferase n=1 Tax=Simiduia curdlanivorans TaxID=1492769 RepID=A0ABV8V2J8_9GAMM|nr:GNAT family N-acetyltransferase [Simiduia curdlanivorans]MDN3637347.1 GNAT family N-acetyltransferase [Simiduia curdlanivorans]
MVVSGVSYFPKNIWVIKLKVEYLVCFYLALGVDMKGYRISTDYDEMNLSVVHAFISSSSWAKGIPLETMARAVKNSLCFGVFTRSGEQVGFARMITDSATFAYLADVFILESHRGQGLSKWLMETILAHPQLQGLRRMLLATADAHGLYGQFGFTQLAKAESFMELWVPGVYSD